MFYLFANTKERHENRQFFFATWVIVSVKEMLSMSNRTNSELSGARHWTSVGRVIPNFE